MKFVPIHKVADVLLDRAVAAEERALKRGLTVHDPNCLRVVNRYFNCAVSCDKLLRQGEIGRAKIVLKRFGLTVNT